MNKERPEDFIMDALKDVEEKSDLEYEIKDMEATDRYCNYLSLANDLHNETPKVKKSLFKTKSKNHKSKADKAKKSKRNKARKSRKANRKK